MGGTEGAQRRGCGLITCGTYVHGGRAGREPREDLDKVQGDHRILLIIKIQGPKSGARPVGAGD